MIDYKQLLLKYIDLIGDAEGISYIENIFRTPIITDEEWEELVKLRDMEITDD